MTPWGRYYPRFIQEKIYSPHSGLNEAPSEAGPKRGECAVSFSVRRADVNRFSDVAAAFSANLLLAVQPWEKRRHR